MDLYMDGIIVNPKPDQSLREIIAELGMDMPSLSGRPLAAKIAGEVFTLNYIPLRRKELETERASIRRAMAASGGIIRLLRYADPTGKEVYIRTAHYVVFLAMKRLWPDAVCKMTCTLGDSVFITVTNAPDFSVSLLRKKVEELVSADIPLIRRRVPLQQAIARYTAEGQRDKSRLLTWRSVDYFDEYAYEDFSDYYYGEMMPSTGYVQVWDLVPADGGFILLYPDNEFPDRCAKLQSMPNFFSVFF